MAKRKIQFNNNKELDSNVSELGSLSIDFSKSFEGGKEVKLNEFSVRPRLIRDTSIAIYDYLYCDNEITSMGTINSYIGAIRYFWLFLEEYYPNANKKISGKDITTELFNEFYDWSINQPEIEIETSFKIYSRVRRLFECLYDEHPEKMPNKFRPKIRLNKLLVPKKSDTKVKLYSDENISRLERTCREEINKILKRLSKGQQLLSNGEDPRVRGKIKERDELGRIKKVGGKWTKIENILWYLVNVTDGKYLKRPEMKNGHSMLSNVLGGTRPEYKYRTADAYGYLMPTNWDVLPFIVLLAIKTGLNLQSILSLKRNCKEVSLKNKGRCNISYTKEKVGKDIKKRPFSNEGRFSPGQLISEVIRITEILVSTASDEDKELLFLNLTVNSRGVPVKGMDKSYILFMLNGHDNSWISKHELETDVGEALKISFRSTRKTKITNAYKEKGNLAKVSNDAMHRNSSTTVKHYIDLEATNDFHEQTIENVINGIVDDCKGVVINDDIESADSLLIANKLNSTNAVAKNIIKGEQDVFIASCKDFYNSPHGKPNTPCELPWGCFTCSNAIWTSRILPRLVLFFDFIVEQKKGLSDIDWEAKFKIPYIILKYKIFVKFDDETMAWARRASEENTMYIPNSIRTI